MQVCFLIISIVCIFLNCNVNVNVNAESLYTEEEAIKFIFPDVKEIKIEKHRLTSEQKKRLEKKLGFKLRSNHDMSYTFYIGFSDSDIIGYVYIDVIEGKNGPITYSVGITPEGKVKDLAIVSLYEIWGRGIKQRKFLEQFINSFYTDTLKTEKKIDAITGATVSTHAVISGIKKALILYNEFYGKRDLVEFNMKRIMRGY